MAFGILIVYSVHSYAASGDAYRNVFIEHLEMGPATYLNIDTYGLFKQEQRAFSHGCIRMDRPAEMAAWVLGGEEKGWSQAQVNEIVAGRKRQVVVRDQPIKVYTLYRTAYVNRKITRFTLMKTYTAGTNSLQESCSALKAENDIFYDPCVCPIRLHQEPDEIQLQKSDLLYRPLYDYRYR